MIEVLVSFDTTGSMYPAVGLVKRNVTSLVKALFAEIPDLRMGIITHGDYCDGDDMISMLELTSDEKKVVSFVTNAKSTGGGDAPECYELVLHEARSFRWTAGSTKVLIMIGDDVPHPVNQNPKKLDWKNEAGCLKDIGVKIYGIQALNRRHATNFYQTISDITDGIKLDLDLIIVLTVKGNET